MTPSENHNRLAREFVTKVVRETGSHSELMVVVESAVLSAMLVSREVCRLPSAACVEMIEIQALLPTQPAKALVRRLPFRSRGDALSGRSGIAAILQPDTDYGCSNQTKTVDDIQPSDRRSLQWRRVPASRPARQFRIHLCPQRIQDARSHAIVSAVSADVHDPSLHMSTCNASASRSLSQEGW